MANLSSPPSSPPTRIRILAGLALPLVAFLALLQVSGNATVALAITDAIPLLWLVIYGIWRRRIEPIGLFAIAAFALALVLTITFGGSSLPLELRRSVFPGALGLACLISLAARRPLLAIAARRLAAARAGGSIPSESRLDAAGARRAFAVLTGIIGVACGFDAAAQIVLALTVSTSTFGVVARVASYAIIGTGLVACALYLRWARRRWSGGGQ